MQQEPKRRTRRTKTKFDDNKSRVDLVPRNENQAKYIEALSTADQVIVFGPAGTGKT